MKGDDKLCQNKYRYLLADENRNVANSLNNRKLPRLEMILEAVGGVPAVQTRVQERETEVEHSLLAPAEPCTADLLTEIAVIETVFHAS